MSASELLHRRLRTLRARREVLRWEYRQRHRAKGSWYRLRRALTDAARVFSIPEEEAQRLIDEGAVPLAVGSELHPQKTLLVVAEERALKIPQRSELRATLSTELLAARYLVLVPFPE